MISLPVFNAQGQKLDPMELDETRLGKCVKRSLLRQAVQMYENNQHVCTKGGLSRGMVAGTTKKMYKQKHTGTARSGQRSAPRRRGAGLAFPPQGRDISWHMPRQARRVATRSALLARLRDNAVTLLDDLSLDSPKTKTIVALFKSLEVAGRCLLVLDGDNGNVVKSARNIPGVEVRRASDVNALDLLTADRLVFTQAAFNRVIEAVSV